VRHTTRGSVEDSVSILCHHTYLILMATTTVKCVRTGKQMLPSKSFGLGGSGIFLQRLYSQSTMAVWLDAF